MHRIRQKKKTQKKEKKKKLRPGVIRRAASTPPKSFSHFSLVSSMISVASCQVRCSLYHTPLHFTTGALLTLPHICSLYHTLARFTTQALVHKSCAFGKRDLRTCCSLSLSLSLSFSLCVCMRVCVCVCVCVCAYRGRTCSLLSSSSEARLSNMRMHVAWFRV